MTQSAFLMIARLCSTTITVLPLSRGEGATELFKRVGAGPTHFVIHLEAVYRSVSGFVKVVAIMFPSSVDVV